jgi:hypothetical protein
VLDLDQRPDRDEAARARRWCLDIEREVLVAGEFGETPVGAITHDGVDARQVRQPVAQELAGGDDVVGSGGVHASGERQA